MSRKVRPFRRRLYAENVRTDTLPRPISVVPWPCLPARSADFPMDWALCPSRAPFRALKRPRRGLFRDLSADSGTSRHFGGQFPIASLRLVTRTVTPGRYAARQVWALEIARSAGLAYAHQKLSDQVIPCHNCGGVLLRIISPYLACNPCTMGSHFCPFWTHEQHATNQKCDHCGARVPIHTLPPEQVLANRKLATELTRSAVSVRQSVAVAFPSVG
jgi:hypothetical protein